MSPALQEGDFTLLKEADTATAFELGNIVVIRRLGEPMMIKRIAAKNQDGTYQLAGDNPESISKIDLGNIQRQQIIGKAVLKVGKSGIQRL